MWQKPVLLRLIEPVDLINKQKRPLPLLAPQLCRIKHAPQFRHTRENRTDLNEMQIGFIRQQPRNRGLAYTGRSPENQ